MAWISAGNSNKELVEQLEENGVIKSSKIKQAFKFTDRGDFVPPEFKSQAYLDRPFKQRYFNSYYLLPKIIIYCFCYAFFVDLFILVRLICMSLFWKS